MNNPFQLADTLERFVDRSGYTVGQLARLTGVPKKTIANWLSGRVKKPHHPDGVIKIAQALHLTVEETAVLLTASGHEPTAPAPPTAPPSTKPFQVIADLPYFVGRKEELATLKKVLTTRNQSNNCCLYGMGGVGKTTLAAHIAYQLRPYFSDGVLWARIHNNNVMAILSTFAQAYQTPVEQYTNLADRSRVVRNLLASKRLLIILDDVPDDEMLAPLLPPSGVCAVIITTRHHDLGFTWGFHRFHIQPFADSHTSLQLFTKIMGQSATQQAQKCLTGIANAVGHLPLALTIAATRLAYEPYWTAQEFSTQLTEESTPLDELTSRYQNIRQTLTVSYQALSTEQQMLFITLGVFGGYDFEPTMVAAIINQPQRQTQNNLRKLYMLSLLQQAQYGRYQLHPLVQNYVQEKAHPKDVIYGMVKQFVLYIIEHQHNHPAIEKELNIIYHALNIAYEEQFTSLLIDGALALFHFLQTRGLYEQAEVYLTYARTLAVAEINHPQYAHILLKLARINRYHGQLQTASTYLTEALNVSRLHKTDSHTLTCLTELGIIHGIMGDYNQAQAYFEQGVRLSKKVNSRQQTWSLNVCLGTLANKRGNHDLANHCFRESLQIARQIDPQGEQVATCLINLGFVAILRNDYQEAEAYARECLILAESLQKAEIICACHHCLGQIMLDCEHWSQAKQHLQISLQWARQAKLAWRISACLIMWGRYHAAQAAYDEAAQFINEALKVAEQVNAQEFVGRAHYELAKLAYVREEWSAAQHHGQESLTIFTKLGHYQVNEVRQWLTKIQVPCMV